MELLNHDLAHEFPQYLDKMRVLKTTNTHFAKLFDEYDEDDHAIKKVELGAGVMSDDALEALKKRRLLTKDQIYHLLLGA